MMAALTPLSESTSGRARDGMKPCTNALYVSLMSRCDSAAIVPKTREDLPDPETPVNTVSLRLGIDREMSCRLFSRAPCTSMKSCESAAWVRGAVSVTGCSSRRECTRGRCATPVYFRGPTLSVDEHQLADVLARGQVRLGLVDVGESVGRGDDGVNQALARDVHERPEVGGGVH